MVDTLSLNGAWTLEEACGVQQIPAQVPGSVLNDLLNNHLIPDPFVGENELITTPLFDRDYAYQRTFQVNAAFLAREHVELLFEGLDTLATVYVNGQEIGKADNMHRSWRFDVKRALHSGENRLRVVLASPNQFLKKAIADHPDVTYEAVGTMRGNFALRKAHCMFGWDWGPQLPDAGIWRPVSLESWNGARLAEVRVLQSHEDGKVRLTITPVTRGGEAGLPCRVELMQPDGSLCVRAEARTGETTELTVEQPQLWWPNGLGKHPLYTLRVTLLSDSGEAADRWSRRVGLRTLTVERKPDQWGESFAFACNGVPFFAMGADYIPEDNLIPRVNKGRTRRLLADCVAANFNAVRVWGGGYYPNDFFFDLCDEMGLVVWLDLMFACNVYELTDNFRENIRLEAIENMLRVRDHACLGLVCGNNEMETAWCNWDDVSCHCDRLRQQYLEQFEDVLKKAVEQSAPQTFYWPSSPSSGGGFDDPNGENRGDVHYWDVWHGNKPFTDYRRFYFRFCSEFGFQSFPCLKTVNTFAQGREQNIFSRVMENHQKNPGANGKILSYLSRTLRLPNSFKGMLYASQLLQAEAIRYGVEHWRRNRGRCMGAIYWQLNDCWPVASWASIDYYGRWKGLHYAAKRFFAPLLASCVTEGQTARMYVTNDSPEDFTGELVCQLLNARGEVLRREQLSVTCAALSAQEVGLIDFTEQFDASTLHPEDERLVAFTLTDTQGKAVSEGCELFCAPKHFDFQPPRIRWEAEEQDDAFRITLDCDAVAYGVCLDLAQADGCFSDNWFLLVPGQTREVYLSKATLSVPLTLHDLQSQLTVESIYDIG